jgi:hypothetical protein
MLTAGDFYEEFLTSINKHGVEYMIFGGFAVNMYGFSRVTEDLDIWINPSDNNLYRLEDAIAAMGFAKAEQLNNFIAGKSIMLRIADGDFRIDLLTKLNIKKTFSEAYTHAEGIVVSYGKIFFISYPDLIDEKIRSKRPKDLIDVEQLRKIRNDV